MKRVIYIFLIAILVVTGCDKESSPEIISPPQPAIPTPPRPPEPVVSNSNYYTINKIDFTDNHALRVKNKDEIGEITKHVQDLFLNKTVKPKDEKYKDPEVLLADTTSELENIFKKSRFIKKAFENYKVNSYFPMNKMLRENKYYRPLVGDQADCNVDPTADADYGQQNRNLIRCLDLAYQEKALSTGKPAKKTILFRTIRPDQGLEFDGLKYGCFNKEQTNYLADLAFGSATTSLGAALYHHDNIGRDLNKKRYADSIYKNIQKAILLMIEVDADAPVFKFPDALNTGTVVSVDEKEVLLNRGFKLEFSCKPNDFLPEIPNEFEYIPDFKVNAATPTDYKAYRVIRAKLVYPKN